MTTLIRNARILTMDDQLTEFSQADILIRDSKIELIGPNLIVPEEEPDLTVIDGEGKLVMPGLVNAHVHTPGNFVRGSLDNLPLEIFMLYEVPPLSDKPPDYRTNYVRTMLGTMEMLKLGITSVQDDAFYVPVPSPEAIDGLMQSYTDSGMRCVATLDQPNVVEYEKYPYLFDLLPQNIREGMENAPIMQTKELTRTVSIFAGKVA